MDGTRFDLLTKSLFDHAPRREAVKALAGGGLAAVATRLGLDAADARKKRRKKKKKKAPAAICRERRETCGGNERCCGDAATIACREFPSTPCPALTGSRCCGLEGASCNRNTGAGLHCECCPDLFCSLQGRCQEQAT